MSAADLTIQAPSRDLRSLGVCWIIYGVLRLIAAVWLARHMGVAPQRFARAIESLAIMGMRAGVVTLLLVSLLLRARLSLLGQASRP